ncbi:TRAP transporter substrate-binding protein [Pseudoroseicyclus aestuarii]|uniref:Tripartite ATP-independent transporter DctP family solute receptor n=1 Tax=Pseudoroseicyclus aestuarii TaxID=1795041 RepID=A0A318STX0_9RHOB|nr:TRAP transporter substrate-binding protein [Pseudoroseicyclus aestuarii]PYE84902.1 tripartite ATP-independent transporter DctP family solute receptor [Pseudoroseicyclus aestuarii]
MSKMRMTLVTAMAAAAFGGAAQAETLRFATTLPEADNPETRAMQAFEQYVEFHSGGDIDVQLLHGGVGGDRELLENVRNGIFQMTATTDGALASFYPKVQVFSTPYLFSSVRSAMTFMNEAEVMDEFVADVEDTAGLRIVGYAADGFRNFVNNERPIEGPDDVQGLKLRSMESPVMISLMESLGAAPTPIPFPESAMAIRQGVVDGGENPPSTVINGGWAEVIDYMSLDEHIFSAVFAYANPDFIDGLNDQSRRAVLDGVQLYSSIMLAGKGQGYLDDTQRIRDMGVEVYVNDAEQKAAFRERTQAPVIDFLSGELGADYVEGFIAAVDEVEAELYPSE